MMAVEISIRQEKPLNFLLSCEFSYFIGVLVQEADSAINMINTKKAKKKYGHDKNLSTLNTNF